MKTKTKTKTNSHIYLRHTRTGREFMAFRFRTIQEICSILTLETSLIPSYPMLVIITRETTTIRITNCELEQGDTGFQHQVPILGYTLAIPSPLLFGIIHWHALQDIAIKYHDTTDTSISLHVNKHVVNNMEDIMHNRS